MSEHAEDPTPGGALSGLIEIERSIEADVARAESDATRRVEAVREELRATSKDTKAADAEALQALRNAIAEECARTIVEIDEQATADVERYERIGERERAELANGVAAEIATGTRSR